MWSSAKQENPRFSGLKSGKNYEFLTESRFNRNDFFKNNCRPFREIKIETNTKSWDRVYNLNKGNVYTEVNRIDSNDTTRM